MQTIEQYLPEHQFFRGLDPSVIELLAGCAVNVHFHPQDYLFREGESADTFYVVRRGRVSIEVNTPAGARVLDAAHEDEVVGWSWLVPPYRWMFDARATSEVSAVAFDATCLRAKSDADPAIGYALLQRVAQVMLQRLQSARIRLMDVYGSSDD